jgi:hypothetical protein
MKFAFLGYHQESGWDAMSESEQAAMVRECFTYDARLLKEGRLLEIGAPLQASRTAKTLRWQSGKVLVTDGPYAETKEQLGGIGLLEADDMKQAVELMSKHPGLRYGSTFEIRPINEESLERQAKSIATLRPTAPRAVPQSARFASLGYIDERGWEKISVDERDVMMRRCQAFDEARIESGQWVTGIALQSAGTAKTLRTKGGHVIVTDGPFAETKEYLGGLVVLAFKDLSDAVSMLSVHPALPFGVSIEIRPINEPINETWKTMRE